MCELHRFEILKRGGEQLILHDLLAVEIKSVQESI
jgi:hypothetical protein